MKEYLLRFSTPELDENGCRVYQFWKCQADDYPHAVEQLLDAEPDTDIYEPLKPAEL